MKYGLKIPDDVEWVTYDYPSFVSSPVIPSASVIQPFHKIGRMAANILMDKIEHNNINVNQKIVLKSKLVVHKNPL